MSGGQDRKQNLLFGGHWREKTPRYVVSADGSILNTTIDRWTWSRDGVRFMPGIYVLENLNEEPLWGGAIKCSRSHLLTLLPFPFSLFN